MFSHHREAVERLTVHYQDDPAVIAIILTGSVARDDAREDSDIDLVILVGDEEYKKRQSTHTLDIDLSQFTEYENGQAGGVFVSKQFLQEAVNKADERERFHFFKAKVLFTEDPEVTTLVRDIAQYPEVERTEKMMSFRSQLPVHLAYLQLAVYSKNNYLLAETVSSLVLFGGRLLLAHNRMLYPSRKWFMREFAAAPDKPEGIIELAEALLKEPSIEKAREFHDAIVNFQEWPEPPEGFWQRFREDNEWTWRSGKSPIADR